MTEIKNLIDQAKAQGLTVYAPERLTTYFYFTDGQRIGYAQSNRSGPSFATVHKPNRTTGTGFAAEDFTEALSFAPAWAGNSLSTVTKYKNWQDFARAHWQPLTQQ